MSETTLQQVDNYRETSQLIREISTSLTEDQLTWKPAPEKWSVKEVVAHLVDSSFVHSVRIRKIVAEQAQDFILYDQDAWVASSRANESSFEEILLAFDAILAYNARYYERLKPEQWEHKGLNNGKEVSAADLFQGFIRHVNIHLAQIQRNLNALPAALR
ncbi:DinB family protein [Paenibacillus alba]|uniref:DinB family protein n=1 Tax=Paenibacillus alba TaxID=1197127 RepID=UPI001566A211|nr:DinB family protein [Paenibacillus alba]NQX68570.1 DinB family protein [Paenibacillus alba]